MTTATQRGSHVDTESGTLTVGQVAAAAGVAPSAVRFYDKYGVIHAVRGPGNQRIFHEDAACRLQVARLAQRIGLTVREIAEALADVPEDAQPEDWAVVADRLVREAEQRTADLKKRLSEMTGGAKLCEIGEELASAG